MNMDRSAGVTSNKMNNRTNEDNNDKDGSLKGNSAPVAEVHHADAATLRKRVIGVGPARQQQPQQREEEEEAPRATKKPRRSSLSSSSSSSSHSQGYTTEDELEELEELEELAKQYREHKRIQDALRADTMKVLMLLNAVRAAIHCRRGVQRLANVTGCSPGTSKMTMATMAAAFSGPAAVCRRSSVPQLPFDTSAAAAHPSSFSGRAPASLPEYNDEEREREQFSSLLQELMAKEMERAATRNATVARVQSAVADTEAAALTPEGREAATAGTGAGANALAGEGAPEGPGQSCTATSSTTSSSLSSAIPDDGPSFSSSPSSPGEDASDWFVGEEENSEL